MTPTAKQVLLTALVASFAIQTALVYSDERGERLTETAIRGRELWHKNACQVCHQVYGNGGFLGPDLTNAASRVDSIRLVSLLTAASGQMPAFHFTDQEIADLRAYLEALDRPDLGRGQLRLGTAGAAPWQRFTAVMDDALPKADAAVLRGWEVLSRRPCTGCHLPLAAAPGGAPDLSLAARALSPNDLAAVLAEGRPSKGMPPPIPPLNPQERDDLTALLIWFAERRDTLVASLRALEEQRSFQWRAIPWWEYR